MTRPIKFRALLAKGKNIRWVYYSTFEIPFIDDGSWDAIIVKDSQSVGLTDKNGVEIFEGDIVRYDNGLESCTPELIKWSQGGGCWVKGDGNWDDDGFTISRAEKVEVIGNIYENPSK